MSYPETIKYLESFINYEKIPVYPYKESLKLERIKGFLCLIGNPQDSLKCIHVAGTKGKGSTCAFIAYILREAGFKVGLYTSPHLSDFRERIRVLRRPSSVVRRPSRDFEGMISKKGIASLVGKLKPAIDKYNKSSEYGPLTFFEVYTALAFVYFKREKIDFAVLETGLGGRLDATNVVNSLVCALTPLSYEHTQKLGNTLRQIAAEKAGIIKSCRPSSVFRRPSIVITAPQEKEAIEVIKNRCKATGAALYEVDKNIQYRKTNNGFSVEGIFGKYSDLKIRLSGSHQIINASVAVNVIETLRFHEIRVSVNSIRRGLLKTVWPGRCEVIARNPTVVLDGAQNIASARALKEAISSNFKYRKLILVLGISSDKDMKGICGELRGLADRVILTQANNPRAAKPVILAKYFKKKEAYLTGSVKEAKDLADSLAAKQDLILVCGSLFVVGEYRDDKA